MGVLVCPNNLNKPKPFEESCPQAVYVYCIAHVLILVLVKACSWPTTLRAFELSTDVATFF